MENFSGELIEESIKYIRKTRSDARSRVSDAYVLTSCVTVRWLGAEGLCVSVPACGCLFSSSLS